MKIYNPDGTILFDDMVGDNSYRMRQLMGQHNVTIYIFSMIPIDFKVGSYLDFQAIRYKIRRKSDIRKNAIRNLEYTVVFESPQTDAEKRTVRNIADHRLKFPYTALPEEHLQLIVDNLNQIGEGGWTRGECIVAERALVSYNHTKCLDALKTIAETFNTEWEIDNKTIHLRKVEYNKDNPLALAYGKNNGFKPGIGRTNVDSSVPIEILAVQGGSRNIDPSKYGNNTELLLPAGQFIKFDGSKFEDEQGFDAENARQYVVDAQGLTIQRADRRLVTYEDGSTDLSNIYPKRVGVVTGIEKTDSGFYNFFDTDIPESLDYAEYRIDGEKMTVKFETGNLAGKEFDIVQTDKALTGYNHKERKFMIVSQEYDGVLMPNDEAFSINVGDKYAVFGMSLPDEYVRDDASKTGASWEMFREAVKVMFEEEQDKFCFTGDMDGIWSKRDWANIGGRIVLGGYVRLIDNQMIETVDGKKDSVLIRITGVKEIINEPYKPQLTLANVTAATYASDFRKIPQNEVVAETNNKETLNFAKRGFRDAMETMRMIEEALLENFTESITPVTVQTMQLLVGDESLQFRFVKSRDDLTVDTTRREYFDVSSKRMVISGGLMQHMTFGVKDITSVHEPKDHQFWEFKDYQSSVLDDPAKAYYVYAVGSDDHADNYFKLSEKAVAYDPQGDYIYFLMGILNREVDGDRSFAPLYGFTEILPGRITTDRIVSSDGLNYLDLVNNALKLTNGLSGDNEQALNWEKGLLTITNARINKALKVIGEALIAGFNFSDEIINSSSKNINGKPTVTLDGKNGFIELYSNRTEGGSGTEATQSHVSISKDNGGIVSEAGGKKSYLSSNGVSSNNANIVFNPTNLESRASIVANGSGNVNKVMVGDQDRNYLIGVLGSVANQSSSPAPTYGGWFDQLRVNGMVLSMEKIEGNVQQTISLSRNKSLVVSFATALSNVKLPVNPQEGTVIFFRNFGSGTLRIMPNSGQLIYDDNTSESQQDLADGWMAVCTYVGERRVGVLDTGIWVYNKFKW